MSNKKKVLSRQMLLFEFRKTIGNPYVHIFGVGMPVLMMVIITRAIAAEITDKEIFTVTATSVFLGTGALIPMASLLVGYAISHSQELEKGIPQRMELFGIRPLVTLCNCVLSELIFTLLAFCIYFVAGYAFVGLKAPTVSGALLYFVCILVLSVILFCLAHGVASLLKKYSLTYCVTMLLYFGMMMLGGMMGVSYDNMPAGLQVVAKLLPVTYITRDFYTVWRGGSYNFMPMVQAYLLMAAIAGILLFISARSGERKLH